MPIRRFYAPRTPVAVFECSGHVSQREIFVSLSRHIRDPLYREDGIELVNLSPADSFDVSYEGLSSVAATIAPMFRESKVLTLLAQGNTAFGVARMIQGITSFEQTLSIKVFREEKDALETIGCPDDDMQTLLSRCLARPLDAATAIDLEARRGQAG